MKRNVKSRPNVPPHGTILGYEEKDFHQISSDEREELRERRKENLKEATEGFRRMLLHLERVKQEAPFNLFSQDTISEHDQNRTIREIGRYLNPARFLYSERVENNPDNASDLIEEMKDAKYLDFVDDNCFEYIKVNMYLYVNPLIIKFLIDFDQNPIFKFEPFKPQDTIDQELLDSSKFPTQFDANRPLIELQRRKEILTSEHLKVIDKLTSEVKQLLDQERTPETQKQLLDLDLRIVQEKRSYLIRLEAIKRNIELNRRTFSFDYRRPYSIIADVGSVPNCDHHTGLRSFDVISYLNFYTDGSVKQDNRTSIVESASSVFIPLVNRVIGARIDHNEMIPSTFRSELFAILLALQWFQRNIAEQPDVYQSFFNTPIPLEEEDFLLLPRILTDNYFCIFILNKCLYRNLLNFIGDDSSVKKILFCEEEDLEQLELAQIFRKDLRDNYHNYLYNNLEILTEIVRYRFTLQLVKSHTGIFGNSVADMFAKYIRMEKNFKTYDVYEFNLNH